MIRRKGDWGFFVSLHLIHLISKSFLHYTACNFQTMVGVMTTANYPFIMGDLLARQGWVAFEASFITVISRHCPVKTDATETMYKVRCLPFLSAKSASATADKVNRRRTFHLTCLPCCYIQYNWAINIGYSAEISRYIRYIRCLAFYESVLFPPLQVLDSSCISF